VGDGAPNTREIDAPVQKAYSSLAVPIEIPNDEGCKRLFPGSLSHCWILDRHTFDQTREIGVRVDFKPLMTGARIGPANHPLERQGFARERCPRGGSFQTGSNSARMADHGDHPLLQLLKFD
jgi:hypothetical protein